VAAKGAIPAETADRPDGACASCGGPADALEEVRRVYVTVDEHGRVTEAQTVADAELWCLSCRSLYPPRPAGDDGAGGTAQTDDRSPAG
jgi:hypothetical protein